MNGISIERDELIHILISVSAISLAFSIAYADISSVPKYPLDFLKFVLFSFVTIGIGFILHEMGHKVVGIYYGAQARFVMWVQGLVFMLLGSLMGILFAAPGAVYIYSSNISKKENAIISVTGPIINIAIALVFLFLHSFMPMFFSFAFFNTPLSIWKFGAQVNIMLALFNMIPAFPLDGSKVYAYNPAVWSTVIVLMMLLGVAVFSLGIVISWAIMLLLALFVSRVLFGSGNR